MAISAISGLSSLQPLSPQAVKPAGNAESAKSFSDSVAKAVENLDGLQHNADQAGVQAATGRLTDVHDYMIAANKAQVATEMTVAVRNKAVDAFNEIMRMQV
jgi:flagellar hook-basal body complex protein FliE